MCDSKNFCSWVVVNLDESKFENQVVEPDKIIEILFWFYALLQHAANLQFVVEKKEVKTCSPLILMMACSRNFNQHFN